MKKLLLVAGIFALATSGKAQKTSMANPTKFSLGIEGSVPSGLFHSAGYNFGIGGSAQAQQQIATGTDLTLNLGYLNYSNSSTTPYKYHFSVIPVLAGVKFWLSPKVYGHAQLGAAFNSTKKSNSSSSTLSKSTGFAYSPGIGFTISKNVDFLLKYFGNSVNNTAFNSFGGRLAYNF